MRDYVGIATRYAKQAADLKNRARFGKWVRLAARRFLSDLGRAKKRRATFRFSPAHARRACEFIEEMPHVEGQWDTATIVMHPSHVFLVVNIFGFRLKDGSRRFTTALLAVARKNAKSTILAAILLLCSVLECDDGAQVITAATTGGQARIVFNVARRMVQRLPDLQAEFGVKAFQNSITIAEGGGTFKPINARASTQDGLNPSAIGLDELHAHKTHDLINVLRSAAGARRNPLMLIATTEGFQNAGPWPDHRRFAQQVLEGVVEADHYFALIYAIDEEDKEANLPADNVFDPKVWIKANPLLDVNPVLRAAIEKEAREAKAIPSQLAEFTTKRCNRAAASSVSWINLAKWRLGADPIDLAMLEGYPCWGALDLNQTTDMCSARLVWNVEDVWFTWGRRFVPQAAIDDRVLRGLVPYQAWANAGLLEVTEGDVTDYSVVEEAMREMNGRFKPAVWAYDRWNAMPIVQRLTADGVPMVEFPQNIAAYHPAMKALERAYLSGNLRHGGDPVLTWCAVNLVAYQDKNMNMKPDRQRSADKIDDVATLLMALGVAGAPAEGLDLSALLSNGIIT